jgi:hypothetical protein
MFIELCSYQSLCFFNFAYLIPKTFLCQLDADSELFVHGDIVALLIGHLLLNPISLIL